MARLAFSCCCGVDVLLGGVAPPAVLDLANRLVEQHEACVEWARTEDPVEAATADLG